jgi:hypothetical protein
MVGNREVGGLLKSGVSQAELASRPLVAKSRFQPAVTPLFKRPSFAGRKAAISDAGFELGRTRHLNCVSAAL